MLQGHTWDLSLRDYPAYIKLDLGKLYDRHACRLVVTIN